MRDWILGFAAAAAIIAAMMIAEGTPPLDFSTAYSLPPTASSIRGPAQVRAFRKEHPCPETGKTAGACAGWVVDHIIPLCWGGSDDPANMQWQEKAASFIKDKFEREACAMKRKLKAENGKLK